MGFDCLFSRIYQVRQLFAVKCICPVHERKWGEGGLAGIF